MYNYGEPMAGQNPNQQYMQQQQQMGYPQQMQMAQMSAQGQQPMQQYPQLQTYGNMAGPPPMAQQAMQPNHQGGGGSYPELQNDNPPQQTNTSMVSASPIMTAHQLIASPSYLDATEIQNMGNQIQPEFEGKMHLNNTGQMPGTLSTSNTPQIAENPKIVKDQRHNCFWYQCSNLSPFVCKGTVLCKEMGCGRNFCSEHRGELSILFFQQHNFQADDRVDWESEALCSDHVEDANRRVNITFGIPTVFVILVSAICLVMSIVGITGAIKDVDWDTSLEPYSQ